MIFMVYNLKRKFYERENIMKIEIGTSLIRSRLFLPGILRRAGLATRFRTHTHARAIDDNVRENDLCHAERAD